MSDIYNIDIIFRNKICECSTGALFGIFQISLLLQHNIVKFQVSLFLEFRNMWGFCRDVTVATSSIYFRFQSFTAKDINNIIFMFPELKCQDFPSVGVVEIRLGLALLAICVVLPNTAVKNVKEMTYFDTKPNAFQRRSSRHARRVEKVAQIKKLALDAIAHSTATRNARKTTGKGTRLTVSKLRSH